MLIENIICRGQHQVGLLVVLFHDAIGLHYPVARIGWPTDYLRGIRVRLVLLNLLLFRFRGTFIV